MPFLDLPPQMQERVVCSISAAVKYEVAANIVLAVAEKEGGKPGQWVRNANGTFDVGSLQFNTRYLRDLARYGITAEHVATAGCYSYDLAAWRLRMHIKNDTGDLWTRAANYHSRTPEFNSVYRADLVRRAIKWADWIEARFPTHSSFQPATQREAARLPAAVIAATPAARQLPAVAPSWPTSSYVPRKLLVSAQP
jgi:hypothetical protein